MPVARPLRPAGAALRPADQAARHRSAWRSWRGCPFAGRLLDAGGGTGRIARLLTGQAGQVVVADESWKMLSHAPPGRRLLLTASHAERLPFPSGAFERVIMVDAFHHLQDQERSLAELVRVCAPGGRVVIEEPDITRVGVWAIALFERVALMRSRFRRAEDDRRVLPRAGRSSQHPPSGCDSLDRRASRATSG